MRTLGHILNYLSQRHFYKLSTVAFLFSGDNRPVAAVIMMNLLHLLSSKHTIGRQRHDPVSPQSVDASSCVMGKLVFKFGRVNFRIMTVAWTYKSNLQLEACSQTLM